MKQYIGIPFQKHGRGYDGLDCWGLVCLIYKEVYQIELPSYADRYAELDGQVIAEIVNEETPKWHDVEGPEKEGDVILMRVDGEPMHVGMVIHPGTMIHTMDGMDVCLEDYRTRKWKRRVLGIWRHYQLS